MLSWYVNVLLSLYMRSVQIPDDLSKWFSTFETYWNAEIGMVNGPTGELSSDLKSLRHLNQHFS